MGFKCFKVLLTVLFLLGAVIPWSFADERDDEIAVLKSQVQDLLKRIETIEQEQAEARQETTTVKKEVTKIKETSQAASAGRVDLDKLSSKLKIKGRWAAGYFKSGETGSFPEGSFEVPEGKIQFAFEPDDFNKLIMRMNVNNAAFNNFDYFYLDSNLQKSMDLDFPLMSRLGRMKIDFGEETWSNNPVESVLPSNSAGNVSGSDEGLQLSGKIGKAKPVSWSASLTNGTTGTGSDASEAKAIATKLSYNIIDPLYVSASFYNSSSMKAQNAEMGLAGLTTRPGGVVNWDRQMWELDLRYDFEKGKVLNPLAYSDSKAIVRLSYGGFTDDASNANERTGNFGFVEGTYNFTKKFYTAARFSGVELDSDTTALLNSITANKFRRYSLGMGYHWTEATIFKLGYDWNKESKVSSGDANNDLLSAIVSMQF